MKNTPKNQINKCQTIINTIKKNYSEKIIGQDELINSILISLMSNGHILLESVPGLAKTTSAKVLNDLFGTKYSRIQCTPDLLPNDIIGTQIFNYKTNTFETKLGPINSNIVLIDEINRSSAKTQSATLEVMQEKQITIDNITYKVPDIFIVIATQNPIEENGIYQMSEAQLDRFLIKEVINYPSIENEIKILDLLEDNHNNKQDQKLKIDDIKYLQETTKNVHMDSKIKEYIVKIINATRYPDKYLDKDLSKYIEIGSSPRGTISFMICSKALALIKGRNYVIPDDVKDIKYLVLRHRIILNYIAYSENINVEKIIDAIFERIDTP